MKYTYDACREPTRTGHAEHLRIRRAEWDSTTSLIDDRARFYDSSTGRFLTPDPMGGGYAYADDDPVNRVDPTGRWAVSWYSMNPGGGGEGCTMTMYQAGVCANFGDPGSAP